MSNKLDYQLKEWGEYYRKNVDWADCLGANILYRAGILAGRVQGGASGHSVLCPDCTPHVRRIDRLVRRIPDANRDALILWYCLPKNQETQKPFTYRELAEACGIKESSFKDRLKRARRFLRKELTTG